MPSETDEYCEDSVSSLTSGEYKTPSGWLKPRIVPNPI